MAEIEQLKTPKSDLILGDCLERMKEIPDKSVDLCLTDPPYGTTACKWDSAIPFKPMWEQLKRIVKDNGAICLFGSEPFSSALRMSNIKMFKYDWYWYKNTQSGISLSKKQPMRSIELISVFGAKKYYPQKMKSRDKTAGKRKESSETKDKYSSEHTGNMKFTAVHRKHGKTRNTLVYPRNVLEYKVVTKKGILHSTQKPVALLEYLIRTYTLENETVLDFTMGSGSTGVAARNLKRNFIGIEKDKEYFEIAKDRISNGC